MELINEYREKYGPGDDDRYTEFETQEMLGSIPEEFSSPLHLKRIFSLMDLTTLNPEDNNTTAHKFTNLLNAFPESFPDMPSVAAVCVYPLLVEEIRKCLVAPGVKLAAVGAGFPSSQTFLAIKLAECGLLVKKGADEIDVVISAGRFLDGEYLAVLNELILIREATSGAKLKVILETGLLKSAANIRLASLIAMEAGADFIKTSTGKIPVSATPEAVNVMAKAIRDYYTLTGKVVGIKPAGGIVEVGDAITYYYMISKLLGDEWLCPEHFRIGASRLANNLLTKILDYEVRYF
ncbi:MAG: deoxyribose-phosphate aldolase [Porphyromonadaceae bacterium]|nr:MAG: deoxyribose-phosphate aldolase [Porphyromonadaceae bacterium]